MVDVKARAGLQVGRYALALARPLTVGPASLGRREGALLRAPDGGLADVAPLPGLSPASLEDELDRLGPDRAPLPALSWARWALERHPVLPHALGGPLPVASAVLVDPQQPLPHLVAPCVLKVKVGRVALDDEVVLIKRLAAEGHPLRLDGNRRLSVEDARRLADAAGSRLAFLEEPVRPEATAELAEDLPVALDETLTELSDFSSLPAAAAWVVKPTLLGAERTLALVDEAARRRLPLVVSSCFESAVGRLALAYAAKAWAPDVAHGLGTEAWFATDLDSPSALAALQFDDVLQGAA